ncbi:MAG: type II secretion system protein M [Polaromonas sp.]|nr:type II secretion system protein M [Polaromonas sp.]
MKAAIFGQLQVRWRALDAREQTLVGSAVILVGLALLWWLLIAPPLRILSQADAQQRSLDAQLQKMQGLQAQAQALISQPKINRDDALRALEASVKQRLGASAQFNTVGDRVSVTLRNTPAEALAQWLTQARVNARAIPADVRLTRNLSTPGGPAAWDGTLVLALPAQ